MKRLTKSATDRHVSGVLGGIAEYLGIDSTIVRVLFLVFVFAGVGSPVFLYILLAILLPDPNGADRASKTTRTYDRTTRASRPRKEAKPVTKETEDDDWSDF